MPSYVTHTWPLARIDALRREVEVDLSEIVNASDVAKALERAGVIDDSDKLLGYLRDNNLTTRLKSGSYKFAQGLTAEEVAKKLTGQN